LVCLCSRFHRCAAAFSKSETDVHEAVRALFGTGNTRAKRDLSLRDQPFLIRGKERGGRGRGEEGGGGETIEMKEERRICLFDGENICIVPTLSTTERNP
jgi:hypothetical protein